MGFWETAKRKARQAKLQGQILLVDRELTAAQHQLGVDIFSLVFGFAQALQGSSSDGSTDSRNELMASVDDRLAVIFTAAFEDVHDLVRQREKADEDRDRIEGELEREGTTTGQWLGAQSRRTALTAEMAYLDREILLRKQIFGVQLVHELDMMQRDLSTCPKTELITLLYKFQAQCNQLQQRKKDYADEITRLDGNAPRESRSLVIPATEDEYTDESTSNHHDESSGHFVQQPRPPPPQQPPPPPPAANEFFIDESSDSSMTEEYL